MSDEDERPENMPEDAPAAGDTQVIPPLPASTTTTGSHVRITGVEAAVAAGQRPAVPATEDDDLDPVPAWPVQLPDWRDPPTREVPRILLDPADADRSMPGPVWREVESDWHHDDLTFADIVGEGSAVPEHTAGDEEDDPYGFDLAIAAALGGSATTEPAPVPSPAVAPVPDNQVPLTDVSSEPGQPKRPFGFAGKILPGSRSETAGASKGVHRKRGRTAARDEAEVLRDQDFEHLVAPATKAEAPKAPGAKRDPIIATATGLAAGLLVLLCLKAGPAYMLGLTTLVVTAAAAECYQALRHVRFRPATWIGLLAVPAAVLSAYFAGLGSIAIVAAALVVATLSWYLFGSAKRNRLVNITATVGVFAWIGLLGAFAGLVLNPALFPHSHGVAYMLGALEATVAYDVGAYLFGSTMGKHRLAPAISPNKTVEGLLGGAFASICIGLALVPRAAPWTEIHGLLLGVVVAVFAPLGDLVESMVKRDIGVKDMGSILPAHGGLLDRIDGLLFVLPATYCLISLIHG